MLKKRIEAAEMIAQRLFAAELAIDEALACAAKLTSIMPSARIHANIAAEVGQDAIESSTDALAALTAARKAIVSTHQRLSDAQSQIGLAEVSFGSGIKAWGSAAKTAARREFA
jgi:hypothetical protein